VSERDLLSAIDREDQQYMRTVAYEFRGPNRRRSEPTTRS
jgi:hypothetical protein